MTNQIDEKCITAIRMLSIDQVEKAKSGHPGMPLGAAPMAYALWTKVMRHNPYNPKWLDRDRFILSAGHGSALLYSLLHLTGYNVSIDDLKNFRQLGSKTPGHPEYHCLPGVEATTGPLGQGFGMGVGMAIAERFMAARYNKDGLNIVDHCTYAIVSDGDLMEGVASEAASLAGHLKLGKLIYLYDDNHISIEGDTKLAFTENVIERFKSYGWHTQRIEDGNDISAIVSAVKKARSEKDRPSLISIRTHIGFGSPKQDTAGVHGEPLGSDAYAKTRQHFGWPDDKTFFVPEDVRSHFHREAERGREFDDEWQRMFEVYRANNPELTAQFVREMENGLPQEWKKTVPVFGAEKSYATREASGLVINAIARMVPNLIGGSADLAPSTKTIIGGGGDVGPEENANRNIHFGVREHAMGAVVNGMALHGGVVPYGATFLIFSDYMRPSIRLAALMNVHSIFIFTHDSIGLGEDGPTHQPIEHVMSLRAIPNLTVIRPADANETAAAWKIALESTGPVVFALTRQKVPTLDPARYPISEGVAHGAYILDDCEGTPEIILIATGSEVHLALEAKRKIDAKVRVVSMPSWKLFEEQSEEYKESVLPSGVKKRIAIEAGTALGWHKYVGDQGMTIGIDAFGASAPEKSLMSHFGFTIENIIRCVKKN